MSPWKNSFTKCPENGTTLPGIKVPQLWDVCFFLFFKNSSYNFQLSFILSVSCQRYIIIETKLFNLTCVNRADTESTSEHLEALKKLSSDLEEQRTSLEDLRDQKHAILPRLCLLDKELVKQQVAPGCCGYSPCPNIHCQFSVSHSVLSDVRWVTWSNAGLNFNP